MTRTLEGQEDLDSSILHRMMQLNALNLPWMER